MACLSCGGLLGGLPIKKIFSQEVIEFCLTGFFCKLLKYTKCFKTLWTKIKALVEDRNTSLKNIYSNLSPPAHN